MTSTDQNLKDFEGRLRRIQKAHRKGYGFEAAGAPGRSASYRRDGRMMRRVMTVVGVVLTVLILKGAALFVVGPQAYEHRVAMLAETNGMGPLAARLIDSDPVSRAVAQGLTYVFPAKG